MIISKLYIIFAVKSRIGNQKKARIGCGNDPEDLLNNSVQVLFISVFFFQNCLFDSFTTINRSVRFANEVN